MTCCGPYHEMTDNEEAATKSSVKKVFLKYLSISQESKFVGVSF